MARGPYQILEIIKEGTAFEGLLNIETPLANSDIKEPINQKALLESLNKFYYKQWQDDEKHLKSIKVNTDRMFFAGIISKLKDTFGKSVFLVRIGRHSGAESVTIEGNRDIKINQGKNNLPKSAEESTTIWLASETFNPKNNEGLVPFGWVLLEIATGNESIIAPLLL